MDSNGRVTEGSVELMADVLSVICMSLAAKSTLDRSFDGQPVEKLVWLGICQHL